MELPNSFIDLQTAHEKPRGEFVNVIGVVVDILPPSLISSGQHMFTFKILDPRTRDSVYGSKGLPVRFFRADAETLPKVRTIGDVVLLRSIKMSPFQGQQLALANYQTVVLVFPAAAIPTPGFSIAYQGTKRLDCHGPERDVAGLTLQEQAYVINLKAEMQSALQQIPSVTIADPSRRRVAPSLPQPPVVETRHDAASLPQPVLVERNRAAPNLPPSAPAADRRARHSTFGPKARLVSELRHYTFADICAQVVKKFSNQYGACELYVTDYTSNNEMWYYTPPEEDTEQARDGDMFGYSGGPVKRTFPGPYGWLVLRVNAINPHAAYINEKINEGDIVLLRNVKMKVRSDNGKLEGDMWPDSINPDKLQVIKLSTHDRPEIHEMNARKDKYWAARKALQPAQTADEAPRKMSKAEKNKEKKQRKKEEQRKATATKDNADDDTITTRGDLNKHIRCSYQEVRTSSIQDILDEDNARHTNALPDGRKYVMPFINAKYRARVRVVDFEPKALEDFAVPACSDEDVDMSPIYTDYSASPKLEWFFSLVLEDARRSRHNATPERMEVHLHHEDAQFLLGDLDDPADLRANPRLLARLREKLFMLWGNLEEKDADAALSNVPFECCIAEYGVEMDDDDPAKTQAPFGWKRLHRMFGTTIL